MAVISYPIPAYQNLPIAAQNYQPSQFVISGVTTGTSTTITTSVNNNYVVGQLVRLLIPQWFGCRQLNNRTGYVTSIPAANQVVVSIDSSKNVDPFTASSNINKAQIMAIGDVNTGQTNTGRTGNITYIPGSFINISP